jgi:hypothetical protein
VIQTVFALALTLASACALNWGYFTEHGAVSKLPPLSARRPLYSLRQLLGSRGWVRGFLWETFGFALYVTALALAPLALVQAVAAGGVGILAFFVSRVTQVRLDLRERAGVAAAVSGLALLGLSLGGGSQGGTSGSWVAIGLWLGVSAGAAVLAVTSGAGFLHGGAAFGVAAGILFAAGDISTKAAVSSGDHVTLAPAIVGFYSAGTIVLQLGFQRGRPLTTAGIAVLGTNAIPIAAAMVLFEEPLPGGVMGVLRVLAFAAVVVGAVLLAPSRERAAGQAEPAPGAAASGPHGRPATGPNR